MDEFVLYIPETIEFTDEQLLALCERNSHLRIEVDTEQNLRIMSPASSKTGRYNAFLTAVFFNWNQEYLLGEVFDSSAGFKLPDGSIKSPDTSFVVKARWDALNEKEQDGFADICPDFVLELRSPTDSKKGLLEKMESYLKNGSRLGWLIDLIDEEVWAYRPNEEPKQILIQTDTILQSDDVLPNLMFPVFKLLQL